MLRPSASTTGVHAVLHRVDAGVLAGVDALIFRAELRERHVFVLL
jgi:hypothetical protein